MEIPKLGFGTWGIGGWLERDTVQDKQNIAALKAALEFGITHIDTAEMYGQGHAEELIGYVVKDIKREKLFLTSKVWRNHLRYDDLINACRYSLKRLRTDYLDLYLVHWPDPQSPIEETMQALNYLKSRGLIRHIGLSNFNLALMKEAMRHAEIEANQFEYNLLVRDNGKYTNSMETLWIPFCKANDIQVIAWRPLGQGSLCRPGIPELDAVAEKYRKKPAQVALNWLLSKGIATMPMTKNIDHLKENLGALGWKLEKEDIEKLDAIGDRFY